MDGGLTVRPTSVVTQTASVRQDATPVRDAVPTNLAPSQTVTAAEKTTGARQDPLQSGSADPSYVRKIVLDAHLDVRTKLRIDLSVNFRAEEEIEDPMTQRHRAILLTVALDKSVNAVFFEGKRRKQPKLRSTPLGEML